MEQKDQNNQNNNIENTNNEDKAIYQHKLKESVFPLNIEEKPKKNKEEKQSDTLTSTLDFLKNVEEKKDNISNLSESIGKNEDTQSKQTTTSSDEKISSKSTNESFYQKTKRWAGTVWSYVNIKNYFPKTEYTEYRNANGDMVKIPKKKLPLKKNPNSALENEQYIVNKTVDRENPKIRYMAADNVPYASPFI